MYNIIAFFSFSLFIRLIFILSHNHSSEGLIEDELMYWNNTMLLLKQGYVKSSIAAERMTGIFYYYKILFFLSMNNFKVLLILQAAIDSLTCVVLYKTSETIFPKQKKIILLFAIFSPLMIILSSQILTETIFLFFFSLFLYFSIKFITLKNNYFLNIALAGIFLGLSTTIRSITFPLILLSIIPFSIIFFKRQFYYYKAILMSLTFLLLALLPISQRLINNFKVYGTFSLTNQTGTHLAYWVVPMILTETKNISRDEAIAIINDVKSKYSFTQNSYKNDLVLRKVSFEILSKENKLDIFYYWMRGAFLNLISPSILLDKNIRSLPHPSYYEVGELLKWVKLILENKEYYSYLISILVASFTSIFTLISFIIGPIYILKKNRMIFFITILYVLYFLIITGPVLSPKYIFPILPCIFLYQGITLYKIKNTIKYFKK